MRFYIKIRNLQKYYVFVKMRFYIILCGIPNNYEIFGMKRVLKISAGCVIARSDLKCDPGRRAKKC